MTAEYRSRAEAEAAMIRVADAARGYPSVLTRIRNRWHRDVQSNQYSADWHATCDWMDEMYGRRAEFAYMEATSAEARLNYAL